MSYSTPIIVPVFGHRHTATVILIHGLGDSGNSWTSFAEQFRRRGIFDDVKFIFPHAPAIPIAANGGYRMPGWYNIAKLSPDMTLEEFQRDEDERGLLASRDYIRSLIDGELAKGISPRRIILGGFSQGGALSIFTGMTHPEPLAGIFLLSSYVPLSQRIKDMLPAYDDGTWPAKRVPVFQAHGRADTIIPYRMGTACRDILEGLGMRVDFRAYTGLHHNINPDEMEDLTRWLMYVLPEERE